MDDLFGLIGLILFGLALYVLSFAAILTILPLLAATVLFFVSLPFWIGRKLRTDPAFRDGVDLSVTLPNFRYRFEVAWEKAAFFDVPLALATAASLAVFTIEFPRLGPQYLSTNQYFWDAEFAAALAITGFTPGAAAFLLPNRLNQFMAWCTARYLNAKFSGATHLLNSIVIAEQDLRAQYEAVGVHLPVTPSESCRNYVLDHVAARKAEVKTLLADRLDALQYGSHEMQRCAGLRDEVQDAFEGAKAAVIERGSPTLLTELDRILHGLESDMLADLYRRHEWDEIREVFRLMMAELDTIRTAAERGEAEPTAESAAGADGYAVQMPHSLEDAYRVLGVHAGARKEAIKKVVDGWRLTWHPDLASDPAEREKCTERIQCINAAWDIIEGRRASN